MEPMERFINNLLCFNIKPFWARSSDGRDYPAESAGFHTFVWKEKLLTGGTLEVTRRSGVRIPPGPSWFSWEENNCFSKTKEFYLDLWILDKVICYYLLGD